MGIYSTVQAPWNDAGAEFDYNRPVFGWFLMPVLQNREKEQNRNRLLQSPILFKKKIE